VITLPAGASTSGGSENSTVSGQKNDHWIDGVIRAKSYSDGAKGKQFLGAVIECSDGSAWIIDYGELSPFHALADHQVIASGEPYRPAGQAVIRWGGRSGDLLRHFRVSLVRPIEVTPDVQITEIRAPNALSGRFERDSAIPESTLSFVTDDGNTFTVINDAPGMVLGADVKVSAYPVQLLPRLRRFAREYLWVVCPYSMKDLWEWRKRRLPLGIK
jgi:hypothetical protein